MKLDVLIKEANAPPFRAAKRFLHLHWTKICGVEYSFFNHGMRPLRVVKSDPIVDDVLGL
ncbi:hypothetical protein DT23_05435 [Thioclava indica]|uniref:Uncharacterized protein n=1 Tax=Thioclava indica TaxID=1353528 RepID=A0A074JPH8_9RHOB|nr:hypothetical protein DT23_05435 [Thioclava indica]